MLYYLHGDHLGSTSAVSSITGTVVARQLYGPYGAPRRSSGTLPTDYRYTGQRSETRLGSLYDYGARFYSVYLNRWLQPDTIVPEPGNPQSLNRYSYVLNSPLKFIDPTGHAQTCEDGCGIPGTWTPPPPPLVPTPSPSPVQYDDPLKKYYGADYRGVTFSGNVGWLITLVGGIVSIAGAPEAGTPIAAVGQAVVPVPVSVGVTPEWDRYGDVWISFPNVAWGKTVGGLPASVDYFSGWINPDLTPATPKQVRNFLSGLSFQASAGFLTVAEGFRVSPTSNDLIGVEQHFMFPPQAGVSVS